MSGTIADVGPPTAHCYTGPDDPENFVHVWTIAEFRNKMEKYKLGEEIMSDYFLIGDTKWYLELYPAGCDDDDEGWVGAYLHQESQKTVEVAFRFFTGKAKTGEFAVAEKIANVKWVEGLVDGEGIDEAFSGWGSPNFVSHEDIVNLEMLSINGSLELVTRIKFKGAIGHRQNLCQIHHRRTDQGGENRE